MKTPLLATALLLATGLQMASAQPAKQALGVWADEDGRSNIEIKPCGRSLCGRLVWLRDPLDANGQPRTDVNNPNAGRRDRPLLGLRIMSGLRPEDDEQLKGRVYNAEDGRVYEVYLTPGRSTMEVEGCVAYVLCGSQVWTRVR